jgi:RNA polymerase sigma-70 factor (ECF subfamily)
VEQPVPPAVREHDEAHLVRRARDCWPSAWVQIYDAHYHKLYLYSYARTASRPVAAKLASQVFMRAVREIDRYAAKQRPLFAWLYRLAREHVNEHLARHGETALDFEPEAPGSQPREEREMLLALRSLPDEEHEVIALHYYARYSMEETAAAVERSMQSVQQARAKALHRLLGATETAGRRHAAVVLPLLPSYANGGMQA